MPWMPEFARLLAIHKLVCELVWNRKKKKLVYLNLDARWTPGAQN